MSSSGLQLIKGGVQADGVPALGIATQPLPRLTRRPGDHLELHSFAHIEPLASIRAAAKRRELNPETALALVIERSLVTTAMREAGVADLIDDLDNRSAEVQLSVELWSAHGSYLHHLLRLCPASPSERPLRSPRVALPVRLIDRIGETDLELHGDPDIELSGAVQWEIAAILAGETMSEWAFRILALHLISKEN